MTPTITMTFDVENADEQAAFERAYAVLGHVEKEDATLASEEVPADEALPPIPSTEHRALLEAIVAEPDRALRIYHQRLVDDDRTDYADASEWNTERRNIQTMMHELQRRGYVESDGRTWSIAGPEARAAIGESQ